MIQIFKFGGASVRDAASVRNVAAILSENAQEPTVVVISAMGKMTNKLETLCRAYFDGKEEMMGIFTEVKTFHLELCSQLFPSGHRVYDDLENVFVELLWSLEEAPSFPYNHHYDQIVSQGEILSSKILSAFLNEEKISNHWFDARNVIQTDNTYREGKVDYELSENLVLTLLKPLVIKHGLVITQGFIGSTSENFTTTLGREGSDYTAALLAYFLDASKVVVWKDVPGVLNADPKYFKNTKKIEELSYHDAIELTYFGASVIHPKTIKPLQNKNIPLYVRSFIDPSGKGTVVKNNDTRAAETTYIFKDNQILISIMPKDFSFIAEESLSEIFTLFSKFNVHIHMMQNSAISFSVCTDNDPQKIVPLLEELNRKFKTLYNDGVQLMTVRNYDPEIIAQLSQNKIVLMEQRSRHAQQMVMKEKK
jgi:aspartate kinase